MKVINTKIFSYVLVFLIILTIFVNYQLNNGFVDLSFFLECISKSVTVVSLFLLIFATILWKLTIFQNWLVLIPNLNGIWKGKIQSDWISPDTNKKLPPIDAQLFIRQSLFHISCVMKTEEMTSRSIAFGYNLDSENQIKQLSYTYISIPHQTIQERSRIHYGTILFDIDDKQLSGNYWTGRKTTGCINMTWKQKNKKSISKS